MLKKLIDELLREIKKIKPDYLFLFGPFIDKNNEIIHSGLLEISGEYLSYDEFFEKLLIDISKEMIVY